MCALLISVITLSGAANRSFRTEMEQWNPIGFTQASNGMTQAQSGPQTTNRLTAGSAILPTVATAAPSGVLRGGSTNVITFKTNLKIGDEISLCMGYSGAAPTLSGATGTPESGKDVIYTLTSQTVTIAGDVTLLGCSDNQLTALDVSKNTALTMLFCYNNQLTALDVSKNTALIGLDCSKNQLTALDVSGLTSLSNLYCQRNQLTALDLSQNTALTGLACSCNQIEGEEMTRLVNGLPDRTEKTAGIFTVVQEPDLEGNICLKSDVAIAKGKNWNTLKYKSDTNDFVDYEGEEASPNVITFTTAKSVRELVMLKMTYTGDAPTLSGATGTPESGKDVIYTLTSQTVTIRGDVTFLNCYNNQLTALDVSKNTALTWLDCSKNQLTTLDVSKNTALTWLACNTNQLTTLDVSKNTALTGLDCFHNQLTALDVSQNTALTNLYCHGNQIKGEEMTRLVNGLPDRTEKTAGTFTVVQEPDLEGNICLKSDVAIAKGKNWNTLKYKSDTYKNVPYEGEEASTNIMSFTTAKAVGEEISLRMEYSGDTPTLSGATGTPVRGTEVTYTLTSQTVTITGDVTDFDCEKNQLTALDVSKNTALTGLLCSENQLTALDLSQNTALTNLDCQRNQLTALDVSKNTKLEYLNCWVNQLTALDVSQSTALTTLYCHDNQLTALDVSQNTALTWLDCNNNQLTALDVSKNTALTRLECGRNQLTALNLAKNSALEKIDCGDNQLTALDVSQNTALTNLDCQRNQLTALDVSQNTALTQLYCSNNQLTALDVSQNTALTMLDCSNNQLTALDVSKNTVLTDLDCSNNQLTALDVSQNTALTMLDCYNNQLTTLDVSKNTALIRLDCYNNQFKGEEMTRLVNSLPDCTGKEAGTFTVVQEPYLEGNICLKSDVAIAKGKNWSTLKYKSDTKESISYGGAEPIPYAVTLTKEGEGTITATGAADLNAVPLGTELTIEATPAAGYELKALTANGTDILATPKFTVTANTEVKATFAKKTAADVVESSSVRLYPNPASTYVNVKGAKADALVRLYDANGSLRYEARTDADGTLQIDLSAYAEGTYLLRVGSDAQRLLIQR